MYKPIKVHSVMISDLSRKGWKLKNPLVIIIEQRSEEDYVACFHDACIYGYGDTSSEALSDLKDLNFY